MARIKFIDRADMDAEQARVFDAAKAAGRPQGGPFPFYIRLPRLFETAQELWAALGEAPLSYREQRLACLVVARHWNARYPWHAHSRVALEAGISPDIIDAINNGKAPDLTDMREKTCYTVPREILTKKALSDELFADSLRILGEESIVALVAMTGKFSMTCITAATFGMEPPPDDPMPLEG